MKIERVSLGEGRYALEAVVVRTQDGVNVCLGGGEKTHIGTVVLCQPRPSLKGDGKTSTTSSVLNLIGHKDGELARAFAEKLCRALNQTVVVTAGIHIESAAPQEIGYFLKAAEELGEKTIEVLLN
ncbi:MAG: hypothetical protein VB085_07255 [Peptococcaceae bacterium]|nr:hypothetical protein [Peptococcaceae bacterium]